MEVLVSVGQFNSRMFYGCNDNRIGQGRVHVCKGVGGYRHLETLKIVS